VHEAVLTPTDIETVDALRVTTPARTAADLARSRPAAVAMGHLNRLHAATGLTPLAVLATLERLARFRGVPDGRLTVRGWAQAIGHPVGGPASRS
jgi:hypothetical protein